MPIGRPLPSEAIEYQLAYINQVAGDDILTTLEQQLPEALDLLGRYTEEISLQPYAPGKWTLRQTLGHITDTERIHGFRVLWLARSLGAPLPGFDQDVAVTHARANDLSWAALLAEFSEVRRATLTLLRNLPEEAWLKTGEVSGHTVTVRALAFVMAGHVAHHLKLLPHS